VKNYFISENQFLKIVESVNDIKTESLSTIQALRNIVSKLKEVGVEDENIVDVLIQIRTKDPFTIFRIKNDFPDLETSVDKILEFSKD
jgi:hypothetical protein